MAQPKKKTSHQKQHQRRAKTWKAETPTIVSCLNCGQPSRPHQVCLVCGYYRGRPARRKEAIITE